jgi:hypothetical protein
MSAIIPVFSESPATILGKVCQGDTVSEKSLTEFRRAWEKKNEEITKVLDHLDKIVGNTTITTDSFTVQVANTQHLNTLIDDGFAELVMSDEEEFDIDMGDTHQSRLAALTKFTVAIDDGDDELYSEREFDENIIRAHAFSQSLDDSDDES